MSPIDSRFVRTKFTWDDVNLADLASNLPPWCMQLFGTKPGHVNITSLRTGLRADIEKAIVGNSTAAGGAGVITLIATAILGENAAPDNVNKLRAQLRQLQTANTEEAVDSITMDILLFLNEALK